MEKLVQITRLPKAEYFEMLSGLAFNNPGITPQIPLRQLSKYASERSIAEASVPIPDCVTCGACCMYSRIVPMNRAESEPIKEYWDITLDRAEDVVVERVFPVDPEGGHCINLGGTVGQEVGCRIYPDRPHICRDFEQGSDRCHAYRRMAGIEPPLTDIQVLDALHKVALREEPEQISEIQIELESSCFSFDSTAPEGEQFTQSKTAKIQARMYDGTIIDLHTYDTSAEDWFEHELERCTLDEAKELIEKRTVA